MFPIDFTSIPIIGAILGMVFGFLGLILNVLRYLRDRAAKRDFGARKRKAKPDGQPPAVPGGGIARYPARIEDLGPAADPIRQRIETAERHVAARRWREAESELRATLALPTTPMQRAALYNALARIRFATGDPEGAADAVVRSQHAAEHIPDERERTVAAATAAANLDRLSAQKGQPT